MLKIKKINTEICFINQDEQNLTKLFILPNLIMWYLMIQHQSTNKPRREATRPISLSLYVSRLGYTVRCQDFDIHREI